MSRNPNGRGWRHGRVDARALAAWEPARWFFPLERLGSVMLQHAASGGEDPCSGEILRVPEGLATITRCTRCGGRDERLIAFDGLPADRFETELASRMDRSREGVDAFRLAHRACVVTPVPHPPDPLIEAFASALQAGAVAALGRGEELPVSLYLLRPDGRAWRIEVKDIPAIGEGDPALRTGLWELQRHVMRRAIAEVAPDAIAAFAFSEGWTLGGATRDEVTVLVCTTRAEGRQTLQPVGRTRAGRRTLPGARPQWHALTSPSPLLDGVWAGSTNQRPHAAEH